MTVGRQWDGRTRAQQRLGTRITTAPSWESTIAQWRQARPLPGLQLRRPLPSPPQPRSRRLLLLRPPLCLLQSERGTSQDSVAAVAAHCLAEAS